MLVSACAVASNVDPYEVGEVVVAETELTVWIADESSERRQGLRGVERLPDGVDGMLFVLPNATSTSFNMRGTLIPLDIWWFDADMTLIGRTEMEPCPASPCVSYGSPGAIGWALETPAGDRDFSRGDRLLIVEND